MTDPTQPEDDYDAEDEESGMLVGYELGSPSAFSGDCELQPYNVKRPGSGCCAVIECECRQMFRIDLLNEGYSRCPKCQAQYTSLLVICQVGDDTMLQQVFEHLVAQNPSAAEPSEPDDVEDLGEDPPRATQAEPDE